MKTVAVMQPYFFPYLGYWQLIHAVERFVIYDDVNYISRGWINRNRILSNGEPAYITMPLYQSSRNKRICETLLQPSVYWRSKLVKMVENTYRRAPYFGEVFPVIEKLIRCEAQNLADYLAYQLRELAVFMGVKTEFVITSRSYENNDLCGQERVIDICKREGAGTYINPQGGQALYDRKSFCNAGIDLCFIVMRPLPYKQRASAFVPYLSIIDVLMCNSPEKVAKMLEEYDLL